MKIKYIGIFILFLFVLSYSYNSIKSSHLQLRKIDNSLFELESFQHTESIFVFFSVDCDSCNEIINKILINKKIQQGYNLVFVTNSKNKVEIIQFIEHNRINADMVFINENNSFEYFFDIPFEVTFPSIYKYNHVKKIKSKVLDIDAL